MSKKSCSTREFLLSKKVKPSIVRLLILFLLSAGFVEISLRLLGYQAYIKQTHPPKPVYHQEDPHLGWKYIPGRYQVPVNAFGKTMKLTIKPDIGRITKETEEALEKDKVLLIGGSFTYGHGLDDRQTLGWKLQEKFRGVDIRNLAVGAYGTYQSLMVLDAELKKEVKPTSVIYGYIQHHPLRNVAQSDWLETLYQTRSDLHPRVPYATLNYNGSLEKHDPIQMIKLPLSEQFVSIFLGQRLLNRTLAYKREQDAGQVTELLLLEMQRLCLENDVAFYVALLYRTPKDPFTDAISFFDKNQINYINSHVPLTHRNTIRGDGHPDESVQNIWTNNIARRLYEDGAVF